MVRFKACEMTHPFTPNMTHQFKGLLWSQILLTVEFPLDVAVGTFPECSPRELKLQYRTVSSKIKIFPRSLYTSPNVSESLEQLFTESRKSTLTGNCMGFILKASQPVLSTVQCHGAVPR